MDLNFYSDLTDGTGQHDDDPQFLDPRSFNGFDSDNKVILYLGKTLLIHICLNSTCTLSVFTVFVISYVRLTKTNRLLTGQNMSPCSGRDLC